MLDQLYSGVGEVCFFVLKTKVDEITQQLQVH
jgi:hypothetical protein